ncbi:hypothetical protein GCM10010345_84510 [Streptomyces canarius]|uniref:TetR family transcriptional regulator n=1 Tax=Streptomyces canarius TaxID=285453 RepID=A0ABQ3D986_9ACTN|nr:hypothetical protein GCM10010345_84510 [Streptomyces canarius]
MCMLGAAAVGWPAARSDVVDGLLTSLVDARSTGVAVASGTAADLVVVQAAFLLRALEALLDGPPAARDADQLIQWVRAGQ